MGTLVSLAWRNLWRNYRRTLITMSSIALGLALSVLFFGLNDGGHTQMIRNGIRLGQGHLAVQPIGYQEHPANHRFLRARISQRPGRGASGYPTTAAGRHRARAVRPRQRARLDGAQAARAPAGAPSFRGSRCPRGCAAAPPLASRSRASGLSQHRS